MELDLLLYLGILNLLGYQVLVFELVDLLSTPYASLIEAAVVVFDFDLAGWKYEKISIHVRNTIAAQFLDHHPHHHQSTRATTNSAISRNW